MVKHNNEIPNNHFHKEWQLRVRTWFDQPMRKRRRRAARATKAAKVAPRPADGALRPIVRCQTQQYNIRNRLGRGFSREELKEAGIAYHFAPTIGIAVDPRRRNKSVDSMQENVQRLKEYMSKLILFPKNPRKPRQGDSDKAAFTTAQQFKGTVMPLVKATSPIEVRAISEEEEKKNAYRSLRLERMHARLDGVRKKRAAEEAAAADEKKK